MRRLSSAILLHVTRLALLWARAAFLLLLVLVSNLWSQAAFGQVLYGTLLGTITDSTGAAVPSATITATATATGVQATGSTDARGLYRLQQLQPGNYRIMVEAAGFAKTAKSGVDVPNNTPTREDIALGIESSNQTVEVTADSATLQTDSGDLHTQLTSREVQNIPTSGYRNYQSLLNLVPGATPSRFQNSALDTPARSLTTNINGTERGSNLTSVDGAAIQMPYLPHNTIYNPPTEAIESVNIVTNSFTAEQGIAGGAVVTVITRSGTNRFHGVAFEDNTNSAFDAKNYFYLRANKPKNILNQFGGAIGGPIRHDKLFFFSNYEGMIQRQDFSGIFTVPTLAQRNGDFTGLATIYDPSTGNPDGTGRTAFQNNIVPMARQSSAAQKTLSLVPLPNLPGLSSNYFASATLGLSRHSFEGYLAD